MKYESTILKRLIDTYGVVGNPRYISEIIKEFIVRGKECFPNLFTYQADWLAHIDEFGLNPTYTVSYTGQSIYAPNTLERPVKSAILKGKTLVNYFPKYTKTMAIGTGNWRTIFNGTINIPLTPNTSYLFINNSNVGKKIHVCVIGETTAEKNVIANLTTNIAKFTTPDTTDNFSRMNVYLMEDNTSELTYDSFMVIPYQEGMENWDIPYFEGMQSVKLPVLSTVGKNLSPVNNYETTVWEYVQGHQGFNKVLAKNILVNENKEYRLSFTKECEDGLPTNLGDIMIQFSSIPVSSNINDHNAVYVHCQNNKGKKYAHITMPNIGQGNEYVGKRVTLTNIQLEEGSVATPYEPYKSNILTVNEEVVLRGIGDVRDMLDLLTGEVIKNTYKYTLTGNESISLMSSSNTNTTFKIEVPNIKLITRNTIGVLSDNFPSVSFVDNALDMEKIFRWDTSLKQIGLTIKNTKASTVEELRAWLSANETNLVYLCDENTIKTVDLTILDQNGQNVKQLMSFNGGTHFNTTSLEGSPLPVVSVSVETDLEEILMMCSLEGNTL